MPKSDTLDLDALFQKRIAKNVADAYVTDMEMFGRKWHITDAGSTAAALDVMAGNEDAVLDYILSYLVPAEAEDFRVMLRRCQGLDVDIIRDMLNAIMEKVADRPTEPSPPSSATSRAQKSQRRSTVSSRSRAAQAEFED